MYVSYYHTGSVLSFLRPTIENYLPTHIYEGTRVLYGNISGSLSENIKISKVEFENYSHSAIVKGIKLEFGELSSLFNYTIRTLSLPFSLTNLSKIQSIRIDFADYRNKTTKEGVEFENLIAHKTSLLIDSIIINLFDFSITLDSFENKNKENNYLEVTENYNFLNIFNNLTVENISIKNQNYKSNIFDGKNLHLIHDYSRKIDFMKITSLSNEVSSDSLKYYFNYDIDLFLGNEVLDSIHINNFTILDQNDKKIFIADGGIGVKDYALNLEIRTKDINYYDILTPQNGKFSIDGRNGDYRVEFILKNVKNMVKESLDKLSGNFLLSLNKNSPFMNFSNPVNITDKLYNGIAKIKKIMTFNDIFYPDIEIITKSVNPFKMKKLNRIK